MFSLYSTFHATTVGEDMDWTSNIPPPLNVYGHLFPNDDNNNAIIIILILRIIVIYIVPVHQWSQRHVAMIKHRLHYMMRWHSLSQILLDGTCWTDTRLIRLHRVTAAIWTSKIAKPSGSKVKCHVGSTSPCDGMQKYMFWSPSSYPISCKHNYIFTKHRKTLQILKSLIQEKSSVMWIMTVLRSSKYITNMQYNKGHCVLLCFPKGEGSTAEPIQAERMQEAITVE